MSLSKVRIIYNRHKWPLLFLLLTWGLYFIVLFSRMIEFRSDGMYVGHENVWSDWALHIGMSNIFAYKSPVDWFSYHPMFADGQFTYPFVTNFISGMLMRLGWSLELAFILPSIVYALLLITGMYFLYFLVTNSKKQAVLAIFIFFLSSGLGWWRFVTDFLANPSINLITQPVKEYSRFDQFSWYSGNYIVGMLLPQRAFLLGMTVAIWSLIGLIYVLRKKNIKPQDESILLIAGVLAGFLPIIHAHSFIALVVISSGVCLGFVNHWRSLLYFILPAAIISFALYLTFIQGGIDNTSFFQLLIGWTAKNGFWGWLRQWWLQWGLVLPIVIFSWHIVLARKTYLTRLFFLGFMVLFVLGNVILFQPIHWDNAKLFLWSYWGFSGLVSMVLFTFWSRGWVLKMAVIVVLFTLTFAGVIELIRLQQIDKNKLRVTAKEDIALGEYIRLTSDPQARFLTAPQHNHFIMVWAARPILIGYIGWVWNYGFDYEQAEQDMRQIYRGGPVADNLIRKHHISYVVIGPTERSDLSPREDYFIERFTLAYANKNYNIYDTRPLLLRN